jgi:hypothetical protein
MRNDKG